MRDGPDLNPAGADRQDRDGAALAARRLGRTLLAVIGLLVIVLGVLIAPLPGPGGLPVVAVGLMIVLRNSFWAKRRFVELSRRHPRAVYPVRRLLRPGAPFVSVVWHQMLKLERLLVPRPLRWMRGARRRLRRRGGVRAR